MPYYNSNYSLDPTSAEALAQGSMYAAQQSPSYQSTVGKIHRELHRNSKAIMAARLRSGARSITRGGWNGKFADPESRGAWEKTSLPRRLWLEDWHPRSMWKGPTQFAFDPYNKQIFTMGMFNDGRAGADEAKVGKHVEKWLQKKAGYGKSDVLIGSGKDGIKHSSWVRRAGLLDKEGKMSHLWDPKVLTRFSAASDFAKADTLSANQMKNLDSFLKISRNENMAKSLAEHAAENGGKISGDVAAQATRLSTVGAFSGRMTGAIEGLRAGGVHDAVNEGLSESARIGLKWGAGIRNWAVDENGEKLALNSILKRTATSAAEKTALDEGAKKGVGIIAKQVGAKLAVRGAELGVAQFIPGLDVVADIWAAYGIAKLGVSLVGDAIGGAFHLATDAMKSIRGGTGQSPFGAGFQDTAASATARSRGVMAITASRLNARSLLGSEGAMMAQYYS